MDSTLPDLHLALAFAGFVIAGVFALAWREFGRRPWSLDWSLAFGCFTAYWLVSWLAPQAMATNPAIGVELVMAALVVAAAALSLNGHCRRTRCRMLPLGLWPVAAAALAALAIIVHVAPGSAMRHALVPAAVALSLLLTGTIILRRSTALRPAEWFVAGISGAAGLALALAAVLALLAPTPASALGEASVRLFQVALPAGLIGLAVATTLLLAADLSAEMKEVAVRDQLTNLLNRRGFSEQAAKAYATARRTGTPVSVIMTDIDRFKTINDAFGHLQGDLALAHFADTLRESRREDDILARIGGEEFALILPGTRLRDAMRLADALCERVRESVLRIDDHDIPITASFGVATISDKDTCLTDIVIRADKALYRSKTDGRDRVDLESSQMLLAADGSLQRAPL